MQSPPLNILKYLLMDLQMVREHTEVSQCLGAGSHMRQLGPELHGNSNSIFTSVALAVQDV